MVRIRLPPAASQFLTSAFRPVRGSDRGEELARSAQHRSHGQDRRGPFGVSRLVRLSGSTNSGPPGGGRDSESQIRDSRGDTEGAFAKAAHIVKRRYVISRVYAHFMEPRGAIGVWDPGEDRFTLYADVQYPHRVRQALATRIFKIPESKIRVIAGDVGGGFGTKGWQYPEHRLVLFA